VAGGAAVETGDIGHAAVVDFEFGEPDLIDLERIYRHMTD
jgi:hypothetical protein